MYHSVTLGDKNTWDDWGLVSKERPFIVPPSPKTNYIDIPGASSKLDFSEGLTHYPTFENRTGSLEFIIPDQYVSYQESTWMAKYAEIMAFVDGRRLKMILEDDSNFFYEGRFKVENYKPGASSSDSFSTITIGYDVGPYKWSVVDSLDDNWLWDPFSFVDGVILSSLVKDISVDTTVRYIDLDKDVLGAAPFCPEFIVTMDGGTDMVLRIVNSEIGIDITHQVQAGTHMFYDCVFWANVIDNSKTRLYYNTVSGTGTLSLRYRRGGL